MRLLLRSLALVVLLFAAACEKDDEDLIDDFVSAVTGKLTRERVDHVLSTYVDLEREALDTRVYGDGRVYEAEQRDALEQRARSGVSRIAGDDLRVMRRRIEIKGDQAFVELQLLSSRGMGNVRFELQKHDKRWLLSMVAVN